MSLDSSEDWTARYEDLRHQASFQSAAAHRNWGWALLIGRGVAAWMRAWPPCSVPAERRQTHTVTESPRLPSSLHHQITMVLTDMILHSGRASLEATA
jgi:hypothetical protein